MRATEFKVLGPLEAWRDGERVVLGPKHRTLLAALLLHANQVVTADQLIDYLWDDRPPASALNLLRGYVSELRKDLNLGRALGAAPPTLITRPPGYLLSLAEGQLDLEVAEGLIVDARAALARGEAAPAAATLRAAAALWRGPALADISSDTLRQRDGARLAELRLASTEERIDADLRLGAHTTLISELTALTAAHPTRERLRGQLMVALYRSGRQVDALAEYRAARETLVAELGIEPGPELRHLERAILAGDPELDHTPEERAPTPWQVRSDIRDFTGREKPLAVLCDLLVRPDDDSTAVVVSAIAGKGGVGKTTLAVHAAHRLRGQFPDGQLYANLNGAEAQPLDPATVLARFLRGLGVADTAMPTGLDDRIDAYRALLSGRRTLVLLDNAADEAQVRPLLPASPGCAALITSRSRLAALESAQTISLDVLDPDPAVELLAKIAGRDRLAEDPRATAEIAELCGGLPLALRIAGAKLAAKPHWPLSRLAGRLRDEHQRLDELRTGDLDVRASLGLSYRGASALEQRAFRRLGLLPEQDFASWVLAPLLDCSAAEAEDVTERLVELQLLETAGSDAAGQLRYRFHDLLRSYARERLHAEEPAVQALLERLLGTYLVLVRAAAAICNPSGFHLYDEDSGGADLDSVDPVLLAAVRADAMAWFTAEQLGVFAAAELAHRSGLWELTWAITHTTDDFFAARARWEERLHAIDLALDAARQAGNRSAEAISLWQLGTTYSGNGHADGAIRWLEPAVALFAELGDRRREAYALRALADLYRGKGQLADASTRLQECLSAFQDLGDLRGQGYALGSIALIHRTQGRTGDAIAGFDRCLAIFTEVGDPIIVAEVQRRLGDLHQERGELRTALDHLQRCLPVFHELGNHENEGFVRRSLGVVETDRGHFGAALAHLDDVLAMADRLGGQRVEGYALYSLAVLRRAQRFWGFNPAERVGAEAVADRLRRGVESVREFGDGASGAYADHALGVEHASTEHLGRALAYFRASEDEPAVAQVRFSIAIVESRAEGFQDVLALFRDQGHRPGEAEVLARIGDLNADTQAWRQAADVLKSLGVPDDPRLRALHARWS